MKAQVHLLTTQLNTAQTALVAKEAEILNLKASVDAMKASQDGLLQIARGAVNKMQIALGGAGTSDALDAAAVIAAHAQVSETFLTKFKVGGVSKPATEETAAVVISPQLNYLLNLNNRNNKE